MRSPIGLMRAGACLYLTAVLFCIAAPLSGEARTESQEVKDLDPFELIRKAEAIYEQQVKDYEVRFYRQENTNATAWDGNEKDLKKEEAIVLRFREVPFSVYMVWVGDVDKGRKVIYRQGWNKNRMKVKLTGLAGLLLGTVDVSPNSVFVKDHSRQPVTMAGVGNIIKSLVEQFGLAKKHGDLNDVHYLGIEKVAGRDTYKFERLLPPKECYKYHALTLCLDKETYFPLKFETVNWGGIVLGRYRFENFKFNNNFTDKDFDPRSNGF